MTNAVQLLAWLGNRFGKPRGFERVVRYFASPEKCKDLSELCLVRDGMVFLARPGVQVDWHVLFFGTYEPEVRRVFRTVLPLGGVALDVGANVLAYTSHGLARWCEGARTRDRAKSGPATSAA
jgi:hypothetical protein